MISLLLGTCNNSKCVFIGVDPRTYQVSGSFTVQHFYNVYLLSVFAFEGKTYPKLYYCGCYPVASKATMNLI